MKLATAAMLGTLILCTGCVTMPANWTPMPTSAPAAASARPAAVGPVMPDDVTDANAHEKARALEQEMEGDQASDNLAAQQPADAKGMTLSK